jgi:3-oxoacyl-[acyl-carrier protein] reductase
MAVRGTECKDRVRNVPASRSPLVSSNSRQGALQGRRAVVTGSSTGIGRAIALELAEAGAHVVVHYSRAKHEAERTSELVREHDVRAVVVHADISIEDDCFRLVELAWNSFGGCDIWVNNAGADTLTGDAAQLPFERKLELLWLVDVRATVILSRSVGRRMQAAGGGVILNMGWNQADTGMEGDSGQLFGAAKGAVMAFSKSLAIDLAPSVRVNCLAPGWIRTRWGENASDKWQRRAMREAPLGRWGTPEDVARVAKFLCSDAAGFITGQVVRVDGGAVRA